MRRVVRAARIIQPAAHDVESPPIAANRQVFHREISNRIIDAARKRAGSRGLEVANEELYWRFLLAAAGLMTLGLLFLQERAELWLTRLTRGRPSAEKARAKLTPQSLPPR